MSSIWKKDLLATDTRQGAVAVVMGLLIIWGAQSVDGGYASSPLARVAASDTTRTVIGAVTVFGVLFLIVGVYYLARGLMSQGRASSSAAAPPPPPLAVGATPAGESQDPLAVAKRRLAEGEIALEEYDQLASRLG